MNKENVYDFDFNKLNHIFENGSREELELFLNEWGLEIKDGSVVPKKEYKKIWADAEAYWDKQQLVRKILLNSAYGGLLNPHMKFFDKRIGQSTTLSGRSITKHMSAKTNEYLCGEYDHNGKCYIYSDTDSVYFSAWPEIEKEVQAGEIEWTKERAIMLYDQISESVSDTFPEFLKRTFNVPESRGAVIRSAREIVAETALFIKKKRYAALLFDKDGERYDTDGKPGKTKVTGLDLRRSDTPKFIQQFLTEVLNDVLYGKDEDYVIEKVRIFKEKFAQMKPWDKGTPKAVNRLTYYRELEEKAIQMKLQNRKGNPTIPGHVRASLNWNSLRENNRDYHSMKIVDGQKIVVCPLKEGSTGFTSIAYPIDELHLPKWFTDLPFDEEKMEKTLIDMKLKNLVGVLKWDISRTSKAAQIFESFFEF